MKRPTVLTLFLILACVVPASAQVVVEEIVARVNDQIVTRSDIQRNKEQLMKDLREQGVTNPAEEYQNREKDVLRDLIDQQLLVQKGKELGINSEAELIKKLDEYRKQMNLGTLEELETEAQKQGVSYEDFKSNLRNSIVTQQVIQQEVGRKMNLNQADIDKYYQAHKSEFTMQEAVHIAEILVSTDPPTNGPQGPADPATMRQEEQARLDAGMAKAKDILDRVRNKGAKFDEIAKKESAGTTAAGGGDLGGFKRGELDKIFEDKVFNLKPGEVTEPIRTKQGFVLLMLIEKQDAGLAPIAMVQNQISEAIYYERLRPELRKYLTELREKAFINVKEGFVDTGASANQTQFVYTTKEAEDAKKKNKRKKHLGIF